MASRQVLSIRFSVNLLALSGSSLQRLFRQGHSHWPFRHQGSCWKATVRCLRKWWSPASSVRSVRSSTSFYRNSEPFRGSRKLRKPAVLSGQKFCQKTSRVWMAASPFALGLHIIFTFMVHMLHWPDFPGRKHEKSQTIFFAQNSWPPKKKRWQKTWGPFFSPPENFLRLAFWFFSANFVGSLQAGGFFLTISQHGPSSGFVMIHGGWHVLKSDTYKLQFFNSIACAGKFRIIFKIGNICIYVFLIYNPGKTNMKNAEKPNNEFQMYRLFNWEIRLSC